MDAFYRLQICRVAIFSLFVVFISTLLINYRFEGKIGPLFDLSNKQWNDDQTAVHLHQLMPNRGFMNGTDFMWQVPESPKAILFIAHGCNGKARNFWGNSSSCANCVGLPEERLIVLHALRRKFAVIAISSVGKCWTFGKEKETVKWILKWWIGKEKMKNLPVVALGASSGGYFVSALAAEMKFSSITLMIAEGVFDSMDIPKDYPPTLFVHMPKDVKRMELIQMNMGTLRMKGVTVKEIKCMEFPLTPHFLSDRMPWLGQDFTFQLFGLLQGRGFINEKGYMRRDGRATQWKQALKEMNFSQDMYQWVDHIQEELNLAYGYHEMTSLQSDEIFSWFELNLR